MNLSEIEKISAPSNKRFKGNTCSNADLNWGKYLYNKWKQKESPDLWPNNFGLVLFKNDRSFGTKNALMINPYSGFLIDIYDNEVRRPIRQPRKDNPEIYTLREIYLTTFNLNMFDRYWMIRGIFHILSDLGVTEFDQQDFLETVKQYEKISNKDPRY